MISSWMLYCAAVSLLFGLAALFLDRALSRRGLPLRWVWTAAIAGSLSLSIAPWLPSRSVAAADATVALDPNALDGLVVAVDGDLLTQSESAPPAADNPLVAAGAAMRAASLVEPLIPVLRPLDRFLLPAWALASLAAACLLIGANGRLVRRRRRWRKTQLEGLPVLVSADVGPAVVGFVDTAIVVPEWVLALDAERRRLVLAHEREHLSGGDPVLLLAAFVAVAILPWNLPLWWQVRRLRNALELDCDGRVLRGRHDAAAYGELLIDVSQQVSTRRLGLAAFVESSSLLAARIRNLTGRPPAAWRSLAGITASVVLLTVALACEAPEPSSPDSDRTALATAAAEGAGPDSVGPGGEVELHDRARALFDRAREIADSIGSIPGGESDDAAALASLEAEDPADAGAAGAEGTGAAGNEVELVVRARPNIPNILELIRLTHPEVYATGLSRERAVWFAIDIDGRVRSSWVGPNLYINFEDVQPNNWLSLPAGSSEEQAAKAEHRRAVQRVIDEHVPRMQVRARYAAYTGRPVPITLHIVTEGPGEPAWGGRDTLATNVVIRTDLPISGERLTLPPVETIEWWGERWSSLAPARIIQLTYLDEVGELEGSPIFVEAGMADPDVIYRLEREPNVFLPFKRER